MISCSWAVLHQFYLYSPLVFRRILIVLSLFTGIGKGNPNTTWYSKWTRNLTYSDYHPARPHSIASEMQVNNNYRPPAALHITSDNPEAPILTLNFLKSGDIVAVPTDTIYGIACCITNHKAIDKLYTVKARNESKPVAICLSEIEEIRNWALIDHLPAGLLEALFPGPVTLILKAAKALDKLLVFNGEWKLFVCFIICFHKHMFVHLLSTMDVLLFFVFTSRM